MARNKSRARKQQKQQVAQKSMVADASGLPAAGPADENVKPTVADVKNVDVTLAEGPLKPAPPTAWIVDTKDVAAPSAGPASPVKARLESRTLRDATEIMTETAVKMDRAENNRQDKLQSITTKLGAHNKKADDAKSQKEITEAKKLQELKQANDAKLEASEIRRAEHVKGKVEKVSAKLQKNSEGVQNKLHQEAVEAVEKKHEIGVQQRQAELRRAVHLPGSKANKACKAKAAIAIVIESDTVVRAPSSPTHKRLAAPKKWTSKWTEAMKQAVIDKMANAETRRTEQMEQVAGKAAYHNKHAEGVKAPWRPQLPPNRSLVVHGCP